jgi:putative chitinase
MLKIIASQQTALKWDWALQSSEQPPNHVVKCVVNKELMIDRAVLAPDGKHAQVFFNPALSIKLNGIANVWESGYLWIAHWPKLMEMFADKPATDPGIWANALTWQGWLKAYPKAIGKATAQPKIQPTIQVLTETWLKTEPIDSTKLTPLQKSLIQPGALGCEVIGSQAGHARLKMMDGSIKWIFNQHFSGQESAAKLAAPSTGFCVDHGTLVKAIGAVAADCIPASEIEMIAKSLEENGAKFGVGTKLQVAHFVSQTAHESGGYQYLEEIGDDNYFNANYDFRDDLGNINAGDGAKYCGRGCVQTTGRANYKSLSEELKDPSILTNPEQVSEYPLAMVSSLAWWRRNKMVEADRGVSEADIIAVTRVVNGGTNGLNQRIEHTRVVAKILGLG